MGNVQPNYNATLDIGFAGQVADFRSYDGRSLICEPAQIGFGLAVIKGTDDNEVKLGAGGKFVGLTVRDIALPVANNDLYLVGDNVGVMTRGTMFCKAIAAVTAGDPVYRTATGTLTNVIGARTATAGAAVGDGNGVMGAITMSGNAENGTYTLKILRAVSDAGDFVLTRDRDGAVIGFGAVATAFAQGGFAFTLADGSTNFALHTTMPITVVGGNDLIVDAIWEKTLAENAIGPVRLGLH